MMDMFLVLFRCEVIRDGTPQLGSTVPLRTGYDIAVHVLFCFLPSRGFFFVACFVTAG